MLTAALVSGLFFVVGCTEFSYFGRVVDADSTMVISGVEVSQQQPEGNWKTISKSDGKGKLNIFKSKFSGGRSIRLRKRGYRTLKMLENQFLQETQHLMQPTGDATYGEGSNRF